MSWLTLSKAFERSHRVLIVTFFWFILLFILSVMPLIVRVVSVDNFGQNPCWVLESSWLSSRNLIRWLATTFSNTSKTMGNSEIMKIAWVTNVSTSTARDYKGMFLGCGKDTCTHRSINHASNTKTYNTKSVLFFISWECNHWHENWCHSGLLYLQVVAWKSCPHPKSQKSHFHK